MIELKNKQDCCGCTACASICPVNAIVMKADALGFLYPSVDTAVCIGCNKCDKVCAFLQPNLGNSLPDAYGVRHKKIEEVEKSRSGAAFAAISDCILEKGGVVYGVGYDTHFRVKHKRADCKGQRDEFRGSKYAQSDMTGILAMVKQDLKEGRVVLFTGTPCQIAALDSYLPDNLKQGLMTIDIVCHGVSSPKVWDDYLTYLEKKEKQEIIKVDFRDKGIFGWSGLHKESFIFADDKKRTYDYTYYSDIIIRPSCSNCHFTSTHRVSDITLADFWGWKKLCPEFADDDKGYSLVLINTTKGNELFQSISDDVLFKKVNLMQCIQPNMQHATEADNLHEKFVIDYERKGFEYIRRKYGTVGIKYQINRVKNLIKRKLHRTI